MYYWLSASLNPMPNKSSPGRPAGSGAQLPDAERARKSRSQRAAAGATRLDFSLDAQHSEQLAALVMQWQCKSRKEAIERAITHVYTTIRGKA